MMSVVVVPIDGSEPSLRALEYAITLVQGTANDLVIVNVQPNFGTPNVQRYISEQDMQSYQKELSREALAEAIQMLDSLRIPFITRLQSGQAVQEICKVAAEMNTSTIVVGSRGAGPIKGMILGSVSYGVLHEATCPVTIVH